MMKNTDMHQCHLVEIETPKKYILNGLWFGPTKPKRAVIWVHGLGSSMFSKLKIVNELIDGKTAVLVFNNRGHDKVAHLPHASRSFKRALRGGAAHEIFTDCIDDIQGAVNFAHRQRVKNIYVAGHSTGCQKAVYWAGKKGKGVKGVILLGPTSDSNAIRLESSARKIARAIAVARSLVRRGKPHDLLPYNVWGWPWIADAQRFLSLYSGKSPEEIFTYWNLSINPRTLKSVRIPVLVFLAECEEFTAIPAKEIAAWFDASIRAPHRVVIVPKVGHGFKGGEKKVAGEIRKWIKGV